jgi:hypothetical protein
MSNEFIGYCQLGIRKGKNSPYQCICGAEFFDTELVEKHVLYKDGNCIKSARRYKNRTCEICDIEFKGPSEVIRHCKTKKHIEKINNVNKNIELSCNICNIKCLSKKLIESHLQTKKHIRLSTEGHISLECSLCNIKCLSQNQMKKHLETKKHKKKLMTSNL